MGLGHKVRKTLSAASKPSSPALKPVVLARAQYSPSEHLSSGVNKGVPGILFLSNMSHKALEDVHSTLSVTPAHLLLQPHLYALPVCLLLSGQTEPVLVPLLSLACRLYTWYFLQQDSSLPSPLFTWTTPIHFQISTLPSLSLGKLSGKPQLS